EHAANGQDDGYQANRKLASRGEFGWTKMIIDNRFGTNYLVVFICVARCLILRASSSFQTGALQICGAGLLLDSALQVRDLSANEAGLTPTKYVQVSEHKSGRLN